MAIIKQERDNFWMLNWLDEFMQGHKGFICGGCFKNIFNGEKVKDLDIFFKKASDFDDAVEYFDSMTEGYSNGVDGEVSKENAEYKFLYENDNVKAYVHKRTGVRIELCCTIFGTAKEIIDNFDFTITKFAYYKEEVDDETGEEVIETPFDCKRKSHIEYKIVHEEKFFEHLHLKRLVTDNKIPFPMSTFERMLRYAKYGYFPCKETKLKIVQSLRGLTEKEVEVSESLYKGMD